MSTIDTLGERVAAFRKQRGLSQRNLAAEMHRSESWVSQVERNIQPVERLSVLQLLADVLGVSVRDLRPEIPSDEEPSLEGPNELEQLRVVLSGHPALGSYGTGKSTAVDVDTLRHQVGRAWDFAHASRYADLSRVLNKLIPQLEAASRNPRDVTDEPELYRLLAKAYQAAAVAFARQDEPDAAWVASDRAISAADQSDDPLDIFAGAFRMAHAFMRLERYDQAEQVTKLAIDALRAPAEADDAPPEVLSLYGAMHLCQTIVAAREGERTGSRRHLQLARRVAKRLGEDRNDFETEFGPTNTELHAVAAAVDLGDAGEALEIAATVDASHLSPERQARFLLDVARAHSQRRHAGEATSALLEAEQLAPEQVLSHHLMRDTIRDLLQLAGTRASDELRQLADRATVTS